jgi:hypothetical protein
VPYGKVDFGSFEATGTVDVGYLESQLGQLEPRFQACYARALARNRTSEGRIRLAIEGNSSQMVPRVVSNTTSDTVLTNCVTRVVGELAIVEREGTGPWAFSADWEMGFEIVQPPRRPGPEPSS